MSPSEPASARATEVEPQRHIGFLIRRAGQRHVAVWQKYVSSDISSVQYAVLAVLARRPGSSQRDLCDELDLDRSTIADLVVRLEKRGLLTRVAHARDRRRNILELTEAGRAEYARLSPLVESAQHHVVGPLSSDETEQLRILLARLLE